MEHILEQNIIVRQNSKNIFVECSIYCDKNSDTAITFYKTIQNKFHYAITGNTAAEIVYQRVDSTKKILDLLPRKIYRWEDFKI